MPHRVTRPGLHTFPYITPPSLVLWLPNISTVHTQTHTYVHARTDPNAVHSTRNEDKRLEFRVWHQTCFSSRWPATPSFSVSSFHSSLPHRSFLFLEPKKNPGRTHLPLFFLLGNKNKLNGKTEVFFIIYFFSNSRHNVYQYSNLSVSAPRFSVRTSRHISYWTVCSYATPYSLHLSSLYFNTVKRRVCFG